MYYAYYLPTENKQGIVKEWDECSKICEGREARYKKFKLKKDAQKWLDEGAIYEDQKNITVDLEKDAIYFDAGTGRGNGVEVKISDYKGNSLMGFIMPIEKLNEYGNFYVGTDKTNNYGELTGLYGALKYALDFNIYKIYGDSNLVIEYWSNNIYNKDNLNTATLKLINKVYKMRQEFEKKGGVIKKISGDINPADLGFHK